MLLAQRLLRNAPCATQRVVIKKGEFKQLVDQAAADAAAAKKGGDAAAAAARRTDGSDPFADPSASAVGGGKGVDVKSMSAQELLELLRTDISQGDVPQSGEPSDKTLALLLDRRHLVANTPPPFPPAGVGYEVVPSVEQEAAAASGLLRSVQ